MRPWDVLKPAADRLSRAGNASPMTDARILLAHVLGRNPGELALVDDVTDRQRDEFLGMVDQRATGVPVQHLTGTAPFRYEQLHVGPGVFVPRPETELLVDEALGILAARPPGQRRVVELCAGSGAIALSLAREIGSVEIWAVEISDVAWPYLQRNLQGTAVTLVHGDMADALHELDGSVDLVVANPPYVPTTLRDQLPVEVIEHDPELAVFGGPDGLDAIRVVAQVAHRLLKPTGWVLCEHDDSHSAQAAAVFADQGFEPITTVPDLTGRPRHLRAAVAGLAS